MQRFIISLLVITALFSCRKDEIPVEPIEPMENVTDSSVNNCEIDWTQFGDWKINTHHIRKSSPYIVHDSIRFFTGDNYGINFTDSIIGYLYGDSLRPIFHCVDYLDGIPKNKRWFFNTSCTQFYLDYDTASTIFKYQYYCKTYLDIAGELYLRMTKTGSSGHYGLRKVQQDHTFKESKLLVQFSGVNMPAHGMQVVYNDANGNQQMDSLFMGNWQWEKTVQQNNDTMIYDLQLNPSVNFLNALDEDFDATFYLTVELPIYNCIAPTYIIGSKFNVNFSADSTYNYTTNYTRIKRVSIVQGD